MYDYRPGYGYSNVKDNFYSEIAPKKDGIFIVDLATGKYMLLVSYFQLWVNSTPKEHLLKRIKCLLITLILVQMDQG